MFDFKGKRVTVMGLGLHGGALGNIEWLVEKGAKITATDVKSEEQLRKTVDEMRNRGLLEGKNPVKLVLGRHENDDFLKTDLVLRNPAVPRHSGYLEKARAAGVPIVMDSSLFFSQCSKNHIIGVTGSKGKTTTANAISVLLKAKFLQTVAVGIDGVSPLKELRNVGEGSIVVFELSSWRLEALDEIQKSPHIAVVTSLLRDHLNTYDSFDHYIETKKIILRYQEANDIAILNYDDDRLREWRREVRGKLFWYTIGELPEGDGIFVRKAEVVIRSADKEIVVMDYDQLPLKAAHERRNLLPAILIACLKAVPFKAIWRELSLIHRLPHRLEEVRVVNGVTYINDSAATMPDATIVALEALRGRPVVHIVGGSDKNLIFDELAKHEADAMVRGLVWLPGTATESMKKAFTKFGNKAPAYHVATMAEAVIKARELAQPNDVILLSPGATSFGLFQHEFDRGDQFRQAVLRL